MGPRDVDALPATAPTLTAAYGPGPLQYGELRLPPGKGPFPVVMVIHGGCWTRGFATARNTAPLASALTKRGFATWNIEYRQVGEAGAGWPGTFQDWGAGADELRVLARSQPLDLAHVAVIGHSAGGHAALWVASRPKLPASSPIRGVDPLPVAEAVAIDGPGDLKSFIGLDAEICGKPVVVPFMGGTPAQAPDRYAQGSPVQSLPLHTPQHLIASRVLRAADAYDYKKKAIAAGDRVEVLAVKDGGHFDIIAPGSHAWRTQVEPFLLKALGH
jgi:acetyl esterase/lipase